MKTGKRNIYIYWLGIVSKKKKKRENLKNSRVRIVMTAIRMFYLQQSYVNFIWKIKLLSIIAVSSIFW